MIMLKNEKPKNNAHNEKRKYWWMRTCDSDRRASEREVPPRNEESFRHFPTFSWYPASAEKLWWTFSGIRKFFATGTTRLLKQTLRKLCLKIALCSRAQPGGWLPYSTYLYLVFVCCVPWQRLKNTAPGATDLRIQSFCKRWCRSAYGSFGLVMMISCR